MRISDWSSDVCSSDLTIALQPICAGGWVSLPVGSIVSASPPATGGRRDDAVEAGTARPHPRCRAGGLHGKQAASPANGAANPFVRQRRGDRGNGAPSLSLRSEEHTSELQSLMRN